MRLMRANMLTLVDFADATFRAGRTEIERPRAVGSTEIRREWPQWVDSGERRGTRSAFAGRYGPAVGERVCAVIGGAGTDDRIYSRSRSAATSGTSAGGIG